MSALHDAADRSRIIRVQVECDKVGLVYATSPDLKGLLVGRPDMESLFKAIPEAIRNLYAAKGEDVVITFAKDNSAA